MKEQIVSALFIILSLAGWNWYQRYEIINEIKAETEVQAKKIQQKNEADTQKIVDSLRKDLTKYENDRNIIDTDLNAELKKNDCDKPTKNNLPVCLKAMREATEKYRNASKEFINSGEGSSK